ncbi:hypothetical protein ASD99_21240 [Mesorhizobium sp. Root695]|uniref:hypothetical protein n=1 Tax=Mesorhizobium sp. Root695 TaxID=1736589 RepID=UPI00070DEFA3|nr:hypothetical protein [Mesorhizobium sp. Root695]KRB30942.1 hypothetical protein ASD99_21240 [Mesorhizobium sp. Root695]
MTQSKAQSPRTLRLNVEDNLIIAIDRIAQGTTIGQVTVQVEIPRGHKMSIRSRQAGDLMIKFGQVIGLPESGRQPVTGSIR